MSPGTGDLAGVTQLLGLSWSWDGSWVSSSGSSLLVVATYLNRPGLTRPPAERFSGGGSRGGAGSGKDEHGLLCPLQQGGHRVGHLGKERHQASVSESV